MSAVLGQRLLGFSRNKTLFCGVRKYYDFLETVLQIIPFYAPLFFLTIVLTVTGILSGYFFTEVSTQERAVYDK